MGAGEELIDRPGQRAPLAPGVRHIADHYRRAGFGRYAGRLVGAVVRYDNYLEVLGGILLPLERPDAPGDCALFIVGRDEHDHVRFAQRAPLLLPVEERHDCRDEQVERRDGKHRTWHNEQEVEGAHG